MASLYVAAFGAWTLLDHRPKSGVVGFCRAAEGLGAAGMAVRAAGDAVRDRGARPRAAASSLVRALPDGCLGTALVRPGRRPHGAGRAAQREFAVIAAWVLAAAVIGWRAAKGSQEARMFGPDGVLAAYADPNAAPPPPAGPANPAGPRPAGPARRPTGPVPRSGNTGPACPAGHGPAQYGARAQGVAQVYADRWARKRQQPAEAEQSEPPITPEDALAELDAMVGLGPVKEQVHSIYVSIEAARRRAEAGFGADKPMRHFVFLGPPGTGKTTVARVIGKIFYAFGLLESADVVEAQRSDLVGEYLGATAIKTNELIDSALGRVLFIDEAYSLVNEGDGQSDRFGAEAVQTLLKRAEDDRENLIIILAGYEKQTEAFLATNPGLASRFATRIRFPTYSTEELFALAELQLRGRQELLAADARPALWRMLEEVGRRRTTDELGNGRFVRTPAGEGRPGARRAGDGRGRRPAGRGPAHDRRRRPGQGVRRADLADARLRGNAHARVRHRRARRAGRARPGQAAGARDRGPAAGGAAARPAGPDQPAAGQALRVHRAAGHRQDDGGADPRAHLRRARPAGEARGGRGAPRPTWSATISGSTAIKTNRLVDSALGGVLFIDEAYSLHNEGYSGGDAFGAEAVQTLLKRAEDDRDRLVIVLAGYTGDMDRFLRSNPGLASRFGTRVTFPSYSARDLSRIAILLAEQAGDAFEPEALYALDQIFAHAERAGRIDELGNGRFARSLFERACACRDVRVVRLGEGATAADLTTLSADDVRGAYAELAV